MTATIINQIPLVAPLIVLAVGAMLMLVLEVLIKSDWPRGLAAATVLLLSLLSSEWYADLYQPGLTAFYGAIYIDPLARYLNFVMLLGAALALILGIGRIKNEGIESRGEYYVLFLISTAGALVFASAAELITLFLGLEIMSLSLYCMCGAAVRSKRSSESAIKYFLLGSFSAAFLLYGAALLYGLAGSTKVEMVAQALAQSPTTPTLIAMGLILVGLVFKIGVVPFHFWAPDVYEGAPTPVTAYMACVIKASAVGAAIRIFWTVFEQYLVYWSVVIWVIAFLTVVVANIIALRQRSLKRMLAYSSIAHAGYLMIALLAPGAEFGGGPAMLFYLLVYTVMTLGAFGVVLLVCPSKDNTAADDDISALYGLSKSAPGLALLMTIFMLSLAGLPPGMGGFLGKFYVFSAAVKAGYLGLAIVGVFGSLVSCYYYLRVIVAMYFIEGQNGRTAVVSLPMAGALGLCSISSILLGVFPSYLYDLAVNAISAM